MAKKSLEEMLLDNQARAEASTAARRQAMFLAYWPQIEQAYRNGWSWKNIWEALEREGEVDFGYSTFLHFKDKKLRRQNELERKGAAPGRGDDRRRVPGANKVELNVFGDANRDNKRF